ncbi:phosphoglycerate mutase domain protein [Fibrobacter succinogenes subsp. succinogenes S85]|uniref:Phosphoglycerate mutase n=1 Tax=Fibrobacter succinogenes (strain ATCC 19169 / S85) TaxID=59374 RepID=C9RJI1_FIBSS|nr:histidine phosphatase family protein [Fibrobacter succinogenes]ACX75698.1 Phosphoglycerate mutase [Fibrobacter succinogenes subsp. succinogenes S85]ADL25441.1 phosphoglycerate mutase domain protein [Fibrobacter succinogenes subsp. succinogenes S85]
MKNISAKYLVSALFVGLCMFAGCGDDSSNSFPAAPNTGAVSSSSVDQPQSQAGDTQSSSSENISNPASSSSATDSGVPASSSDVGLSSSSAGATVNGPFTFATTPGTLALAPDEDGFYDMGDVYKAVPKTSKIAFVIRHSKRQKNNLGTESTLTPIGITMAKTLGEKLVGDESFYYASTNFLRTRATCENIAAGRGETAEVVTWDGVNGGYFLTVPSDSLDALVSKKGGNPKFIAQYSYGVPFSYAATIGATLSTYFYDLYPRGNQFVNEVIVANMPNWKRVSVLVSHDMLVEPLIVFVSNRTINLKAYESPFHWVNYLSGIAVIVDEAGAVTALPVRGDAVGWMIPSQEVDEGV